MEQPLEFRRVGNRCAVVLDDLCPHLPREVVAGALEGRGFRIMSVDIVKEARQLVGIAAYQLRANMRDAPAIVDCSSFVKWLYGRCGIWLPRLTPQQMACGRAVEWLRLRVGDLVFTAGRHNWLTPEGGVGHVYLATGAGTLIHAANRETGTVEVGAQAVIAGLEPRDLRRFRRVFLDRPWQTLEIPEDSEIETADDLQWKIRSWTKK